MKNPRTADRASAARAAEALRWRAIDELLASADIDPREKHRILLDRLLDERALLVAGDEGMTGDRSPLIDSVRRALRALEA